METNTVHNVNVTKDVALSVPGSTPKDAVKYQTKLLWTLTDVPSNKIIVDVDGCNLKSRGEERCETNKA